MNKTKPKIYVSVWGTIAATEEVISYALAEDGIILDSFVSRSEECAFYDMATIHDVYNKHYPNGYQIVWCKIQDIPLSVQRRWKKYMKTRPILDLTKVSSNIRNKINTMNTKIEITRILFDLNNNRGIQNVIDGKKYTIYPSPLTKVMLKHDLERVEKGILNLPPSAIWSWYGTRGN